MFTKVLMLSCLTLAVGQLPADVWPTNQRSFKIPIDIQPQRRPEIRQLFLYVSSDEGKSWQQYQAIAPTQDGFSFHAKQDGSYWFRAAVINQNGKQEPDNIYRGKPDQKVHIDTVSPVVQIVAANRESGGVLVRWEIQEKYPDTKSMKLKYRPADAASDWQEVKVTPAPTGQFFVTVSNPNPLVFRLELRDLAGNFSYTDKPVPGLVGSNGTQLTGFQSTDTAPGVVPPAAKTVEQPLAAAPSPPAVAPPVESKQPVPPPTLPEAAPAAAPPQPPVPAASAAPSAVGQATWDSMGNAPRLPPRTETKPAAAVAATTSSGLPHQSLKPGEVTMATPQKPLPPVRIVNSTELTLDYELTNIGPSGIGKVVLFVTQDDGMTWHALADDPTVTASMREGKYKRTLLLPGEGVYGFALRVWSRAGLGKAAPQTGEIPEMRVEVDLTPPEAILFAPIPDAEHKDALLITWEARDRNLAATPIALEWAHSPNGPWESIQTNLPNEGRFSWQLTSRVPARVYLRLKVQDKAGNIGAAVTNEPQLADLSVPESRLVDVAPVGRP